MRKFLLAMAVAFSGPAFASDFSEITDSFTQEFQRRVVGSYVEQPLTTFESRCLVKVPVGGGCLTVEKTKVRGSLRIEGLNYWTGRLLWAPDADPITNESGRKWASNLHFEFSYIGETQGELWKQDTFTGYAWESLHPRGRIIVDLEAGIRSNFILSYRFLADPSHPDDPNRFMSQTVAPKLKLVLADKVRAILGIPNLEIR